MESISGCPCQDTDTTTKLSGVVRNTKYRVPAAPSRAHVLCAFHASHAIQASGGHRLETGTLYAQSIQLRVAGAPERLRKSLRQVLSGINPNLALDSVKSYSEQVAVQFNQQRLVARLTGFFSLLALVLARLDFTA